MARLGRAPPECESSSCGLSSKRFAQLVDWYEIERDGLPRLKGIDVKLASRIRRGQFEVDEPVPAMNCVGGADVDSLSLTVSVGSSLELVAPADSHLHAAVGDSLSLIGVQRGVGDQHATVCRDEDLHAAHLAAQDALRCVCAYGILIYHMFSTGPGILSTVDLQPKVLQVGPAVCNTITCQ
eukprot:2782833-Prymnesium_polylepis.2